MKVTLRGCATMLMLICAENPEFASIEIPIDTIFPIIPEECLKDPDFMNVFGVLMQGAYECETELALDDIRKELKNL